MAIPKPSAARGASKTPAPITTGRKAPAAITVGASSSGKSTPQAISVGMTPRLVPKVGAARSDSSGKKRSANEIASSEKNAKKLKGGKGKPIPTAGATIQKPQEKEQKPKEKDPKKEIDHRSMKMSE